MKTTTLIFLFLIVHITILKSQTEEKQSGFYDLKISNVSTLMNGHGSYINQYYTKIPFGIGLSCSYKLYKRIFAEISFIYKSEKSEGNVTLAYQDMPPYGLIGGYYYKNNITYFDIPLNINYNILKYKSLKLHISAGLKNTILHFNDNFDWYSGKTSNYNGTIFYAGYSFGIIEQIGLNKRFGMFASQIFGEYFLENYNNYYAPSFETKNTKYIDFKVGLSYKLN